MTMLQVLSRVGAVAFLLLVSNASAAEEGAEALFQDALAKMKQGRFAEACPLLEQSQRMEAKSGTLISLGFCRERIGKTASAHTAYREATELARAEGRHDYVVKAGRLAASVEARVCTYRIVAAPVPGLEVRVNGQLVSPERFGREVAIDPGCITVVASAPSYESSTQYVDVLEPGVTEVVVPYLTRAVAETMHTDTTGISSMGIVGWTLTGAGGAGIVTGLVLGGLVLDRKATVERECDLKLRTCSEVGLDASRQGGDLSVGATVGVVGGLAIAAAGVTLVVVNGWGDDGVSDELAIRVSPQRGGVSLGATVTF